MGMLRNPQGNESLVGASPCLGGAGDPISPELLLSPTRRSLSLKFASL